MQNRSSSQQPHFVDRAPGNASPAHQRNVEPGRSARASRAMLWIAGLGFAAIWTICYFVTLVGPQSDEPWSSPWRYAAAAILHLPYLATLVLLGFGLRERIGYFRAGRAPVPPGCLPAEVPSVCVQLPMFNESAIANGLSLAAFGTDIALLAYAAPPLIFAIFAALAATLETRATHEHEAGGRGILRRLARLGPYLAVNAGMLPYHLCAFAEGLFGPMHSEFERTPRPRASRYHWRGRFGPRH